MADPLDVIIKSMTVHPRSRREFIFKHRSFRSVPLTCDRVIASLVLAAALTVIGLYWAREFVDFHQKACTFFLGLFGIPALPLLSVPRFEQIGEGARMIPVALVVILLLISRHFGLTRNFAGFLILLLVVSTVVCAFEPDFLVSIPEFTRAWVQVEMLILLLAPWLSCLIFMVLQPDALRGAVWVLLIQIYGLLFSALRLAFCVTVMHYTGMLFFPILWFAFGLLATLMYLLTFYSLSLYISAGRLWGARAAWR